MNAIDFKLFKEHGVIADYETFHDHLEDVVMDDPLVTIEDGVRQAAWRSRHG